MQIASELGYLAKLEGKPPHIEHLRPPGRAIDPGQRSDGARHAAINRIGHDAQCSGRNAVSPSPLEHGKRLTVDRQRAVRAQSPLRRRVRHTVHGPALAASRRDAGIAERRLHGVGKVGSGRDAGLRSAHSVEHDGCTGRNVGLEAPGNSGDQDRRWPP